MPNDEIIIIKPKTVMSPLSAEETAAKLREMADAIESGEVDVKDSGAD